MMQLMSDDPNRKVNMPVYTTRAHKNRIKAEAARRGMSMTAFVLMCVQKEMDRTSTTDKEHQ